MCRASATSDLVIEVDEQPHVPESRELDATIDGVDVISRDVAVLRIRVPTESAVSFVAGQYLDLLLQDGVRRSYSMANPPSAAGDERLEFHVRHMPGGLFTDRLFGGVVRVGDALKVDAPLGTFYLRESPAPALMLASGTGYAPIRSILLDHLPRQQNREVVVYWGGRTLPDLYAMEEVLSLQKAYANFRFVPVLSEANGEWSGRRGFVHRAVMEDLPDLSCWHAYACGTPLMVEAARRDFGAECGLPAEHFFSDSFVTAAELAQDLIPSDEFSMQE
jgi:CDP-4-dehydro-6-deoxyglucose reductase